ncbi:hypothetical protein L3Q82_025441 [Scortum barcoo]|uniref:Uncharacterized protein n=1 Tax=Scortum barcoo TaxID=214431 RepID=A0ACB8WMC4_9TELE|nr:hypothetical protein L3Q82_025441 [Scortum barcoo]
MSFLRRVAGWLGSLKIGVRSSVTREELGVEPLLLRIERSQLRWLGHLFQMPPGRLPREVFQACPTGRRPLEEDPGHAGETMPLGWPGNASGSPLEELEEVSGVREVWASLLRLLPPRPGPGSSAFSLHCHHLLTFENVKNVAKPAYQIQYSDNQYYSVNGYK